MEVRREIVERFNAGTLQFLCNCAVLTEGFDAPVCSAIVMGRPTKSLSLYTQMLGRGLRPLPGTVDAVAEAFDRRMAILTSDKPNCLVLDFVGNSEHKLANAYDVLGGNYDAEARELARKEAREGRKDLAEVIEQSAAVLALERQLKELGYRVIVARDGRAALDILRKPQEIQLLFTDVVMPGGMFGAELAREAARLRPGLKILFTSGYSNEPVKALDGLGRDAPILNKPYRPHDLASMLRSVLQAG